MYSTVNRILHFPYFESGNCNRIVECSLYYNQDPILKYPLGSDAVQMTVFYIVFAVTIANPDFNFCYLAQDHVSHPYTEQIQSRSSHVYISVFRKGPKRQDAIASTEIESPII
jgi:hypothetical protein